MCPVAKSCSKKNGSKKNILLDTNGLDINVWVCELTGGILFVLRRSYPCSWVSCCVCAKGWCSGCAT